ncbi:MAG TPA: hypothetical protein VH815_06850, partial [Acidobacteriota bacterium]
QGRGIRVALLDTIKVRWLFFEMLKKLFIFFYLTMLMLLSRVEATQWIPVGPPGAVFGHLVPDRNDPKLWYTIQEGLLYKSNDGAKTWNNTTAEVSDELYVNPADSAVFVNRYSRDEQTYNVYKSIDHGLTFESLGHWPEGDPPVRFARTNARFLYRASKNSYWESEDEGRTWKEKIPALTSAIDLKGCNLTKFQINDIVVSPISEQSLSLSVRLSGCSVGTNPSGHRAAIAISTNRGSTWIITFAGPPVRGSSYDTYKFLDDPADSNVIAFSSLSYGNWDGIAWQQTDVPTCPPGAQCQTFSVIQSLHPHNTLLVTQNVWLNDSAGNGGCRLLSNSDGHWKSNTSLRNYFCEGYYPVRPMEEPYGDFLFIDSGIGMRRVQHGKLFDANSGIETKLPLYYPEVNGIRAYAVAGSGNLSVLYTSKDNGKNWKELLTPLLARSWIRNIAISPDDPNSLILILIQLPPLEANYYQKYTQHVFRTTNAGKTWTRCLTIYDYSYPTPIVFGPKNSGTVYFSVGTGLYRSTENGINPVQVSSAVNYLRYDMVIDPFNSERLFVTTCRDVLRSDDSGRTFVSASNGVHRLYEGCDAVYIASLPERDHYLLQNDINEMLLTENAGESWERLSQIPTSHGGGSYRPPGAIRFYPRGSKVIFGSTHSGMFQSSDAGETWHRILNGTQRYNSVSDMSDPRLGPLYLSGTQLLKESK